MDTTNTNTGYWDDTLKYQQACPYGVALNEHHDSDGDWMSCLDATESE